MDEDLTHVFDAPAKSLGTKLLGKKVLVYREVTSTNDLAHRLAHEGEPEGTFVFARSQTAGRGRMGAVWVSPANGGVYFSFILRPAISPQEACQITLTVAWALVRAFKRAGIDNATIKWPNDILMGKKKVCGILTEMSLKGERVDYLVVGVGVNVNTRACDLPSAATSLKEAAGRDFDLDDLSHIMVKELDCAYAHFLGGGFARILQGVKEASSLVLGGRVRVLTQGAQIEGYAVDFDEDGGLIVRTDSGLLEKVLSGHLETLS